MRFRLKIALGITLILVSACQPDLERETPQPSATITVRPTRTPTPGSTLEPTQSLVPSLTPTSTPQSTATLVPSRQLPVSWRDFGLDLIGLQIGAPQGWLDVSAQAHQLDTFSELGPRLLFVADQPETAANLLSGEPLEDGSFVFAFITEPASEVESPQEEIDRILAEIEFPESTEIESIPMIIDQKSAVMVSVPADPFNIFPPNPTPLMVQLVIVLDSELSQIAYFLLGTTVESLEVNEPVLAEMVDTIHLVPVTDQIQGMLENDSLVSQTLEKSRTDLWTFVKDGANYATIALTPLDSTIDLTLKLLDPNGKVLRSMDNGYAGDLEALTDVLLPVDGIYYISVSEFFNETGDYELSLLLAEQPEFGGGGQIRFNQEISADLDENSENVWAFEGTAGQDVTIILTPLSDQLDVILELRGPDGRELVMLDEGFAGDAEVLTGTELPVTGEYAILVRGFAGHGGAYTLSLDEGGESTLNFYDAGDLVYGDQRTDYLRDDEAHAWFFEGNSGDEVTIEVHPLESNLDLDIWLLDPELHQLEAADEYLSGEPEKIEQTLPVDGRFLVFVHEFFGEPGEYEISLNVGRKEILEVVGELEYGQTVSGTLQAEGQVGWTFTGREGETIGAILTPGDLDRDLVLQLIDPEGETVVTVDNSLPGLPERLNAYQLNRTGQWLIIIQEFFNEESKYELTLTLQ